MRMQVAIAVLLPCLAVVFFSGVYFPARQRTAALEILAQRAVTVATLVSRHPALLLPDSAPDARARRADVFSQVESGGFTLLFQELSRADGTVVDARGNVTSILSQPVTPQSGGCAVARVVFVTGTAVKLR